jgi:hypothetical protein
VQWVKGDTFGLHFLRLQQAELVRLGRLIASMTEDEALNSSEDHSNRKEARSY